MIGIFLLYIHFCNINLAVVVMLVEEEEVDVSQMIYKLSGMNP